MRSYTASPLQKGVVKLRNLTVQLKLMFRRKQFIITMTAMILFSVVAFFASCFDEFGRSIVDVHAAKYVYLGSGLGNRLYFVFSILFPLIAALPFADSFYEERKRSTTDFCILRMSNNSYYFSKLIAVFISGFIIVAVPLLINMLLNFIAFPLESSIIYTNFSYAESIYPSTLNTILFQSLFSKNMYLYNLLFLFLCSFACGLIAIVVFQFSFFFSRSRIFIISSFFILYFVLILGLGRFTGGNEFELSTYIFASMFSSNQTARGMVVTFSFLTLAAVLPIPFAKKKLENCYA